MEENSVRIIIATHKKYYMPKDPMYLPVLVGAAGKESIEDYQRDDEGDNISELNPYFCELTGLYWAWKNLKTDYIGLAHYRRHFSSGKGSDLRDSVLKYGSIQNDLGKIRVFVPNKRFYWIETLYSHYKHTHYIYQLDEARIVIKERYQEYLESFDTVCRRRWGYMFNMMIMKNDLLSEYCTWLFDILFELRTRLGEGGGFSPYQSRCYGRISEILFNVWIHRQIRSGRIKRHELKEIRLIYLERTNWWKKGTSFLLAKFFGKKYSCSF